MYITKEILNWNIQQNDFTFYNREWNTPYEGWNHAEKIISNHTSKYHRIDVIATLKRIIDYRVKDLSHKYNLKAINDDFKKKNNYERLAHLNIIRPIMLKKLLEVRNNVEHKHEQPPSLNICKELVEFVWYFLKSTDIFCHTVIDSYSLDEDPNHDSKYGLLVTPKIKKNWEIELRGWLTESQYSNSKKDGFLKIQIIDKETYEEFKIRQKNNLSSFIDDYHKNRADSDLYIREAIVEDKEVKNALIEKYFTANST
ncbi:hypothetical protein [Tenacibaculum singaporense]|uniref:hypothetical protein n=1 Tax=Tenacibaculum singaporense TaxID=2358479 RepID=UPI000F669BC6|nr:hypothetical protein [Tenacibaculum singaporense]RSC92890.1 hypothetical protein EI424_10615 [Tenacibaculum singaporense]